MRATRPVQSGSKRGTSRAFRRAAMLGVEALERRTLLASIVVNSTADNAIAGDGLVTLREAIIAANNDTATDTGQTGGGSDEITFALPGGATVINLNGQLPSLSSEVSIVGTSPAERITIQRDSVSAFRIFAIGPTGKVTLENLAIRNGLLTSSGGGAIGNFGGTLTIRSCEIFENTAPVGGAISNVSNGVVEISDSIIYANSAQTAGGGLYISESKATLTRCSLSSNFAQQRGGGAYSLNGSTLTFVESAISGNSTVDDAGGIDNEGNSNLHLTDCTVTGNWSPDFGGAVRSLLNCTTTIDRCIFMSNQSSHGGAMYNRGLLDVNDCTFSYNVSYYGAGALDNDGGTETVRRCRFEGNYASFGGGAMWNHVNSSATVIECVFANNGAGEGGAIENREGANLTIERSNFIGNWANQLGGGAIFNYFGNIYLTDSTFQFNYGNWDGGAINNNHVLEITGCTFNDNSAPHGGALFNWYTGSMSVTSSTIARNAAGNAGGGIMNHGAAQLKFITVTDNDPGGSGVGAGITNDGGSFSLSHSVVARNVGGDLFSNNSSYAIDFSFIGDTDGDAMLGLLADNGGPTMTVMPLPGSPLLDAGDPDIAGQPPTDQRGVGRIFNSRIDIGAVEVHNTAPTAIGIPDVVTTEDAPDLGIYLDDSFDDFEDGAAGLSYSIVNNTNPSLFGSLSIDNSTRCLTLDYADDQHGVAEITVRATDSGGWSVDTTFTVTVLSVEQQVDLLVAQLEALPGLNHGNLNALLVKLKLKGNPGDAGKVAAFIDAVESFTAAGKIASADADDLLAAAAQLLASLA